MMIYQIKKIFIFLGIYLSFGYNFEGHCVSFHPNHQLKRLFPALQNRRTLNQDHLSLKIHIEIE